MTKPLASITLDGVALTFDYATLSDVGAPGLPGWRVHITHPSARFTAGRMYQAVFVDTDGNKYRGSVTPQNDPLLNAPLRLFVSGRLEGW